MTETDTAHRQTETGKGRDRGRQRASIRKSAMKRLA